MLFWVTIIIVNQFFDLKRIKKYDYFNLIHSWSVFSPNPISLDLKLFYRDRFLDDSNSDLKEFRPSKILLYGNRGDKTIIEICNSINKTQKKFTVVKNNPYIYKTNMHYLLLINCMLKYEINKNVKERQFVCMEYNTNLNIERKIIVVNLFPNNASKTY